MTGLDREIYRIKEIMLIHEGKQNVLQEYHRDQKFPTEDFGKTNAETFLDWLEDKGQYGTLPPSKMSFEEGVKSGLKTAAEWGKISENELYNNLVNNRQGFWNQHIEDKNGNLYVERALNTPSLISWDKDSKNYNKLIQKYENNVGGCWAWKQGKAAAYCGAGDDIVILKGYIRMEDVDWVETDYINSSVYSMPNECEVRVKPNAKVELFEVETSIKITKDEYGREKSRNADYTFDTYKLPLKGHLIVTATYFGNNQTYAGNYAPLYDSQSKASKFIDRKGNIVSINDLLNNSESLLDLANNSDDFSLGQEHDGLRRISYLTPNNILKYNFINANNRLLSPTWFDYAGNFHDGFAKIGTKFKENFINTQGQLLSPKLWFTTVSDFSDGLALVQIGAKFNFIDINGNFLLPIKWFDWALNFSNGRALVMIQDKFYDIDKQGRLYKREEDNNNEVFDNWDNL